MGWTSLAQLQAQLAPDYQSKMRFLQEKLTGEAQIAQFQAREAASLEQQRHYNNLDLERTRAGNQADADARRFEHERGMQRDGHYRKLQEMQADLNKSLTLANLEYQKSMLQTIDAAHVSVIGSISSLLVQQDAAQSEIIKMYAAARFGEAKAQADHARQLEVLRTQHDLGMGEKLYVTLLETVAKFIEAGKLADANQAIDRVYEQSLAAAF